MAITLKESESILNNKSRCNIVSIDVLVNYCRSFWICLSAIWCIHHNVHDLIDSSFNTQTVIIFSSAIAAIQVGNGYTEPRPCNIEISFRNAVTALIFAIEKDKILATWVSRKSFRRHSFTLRLIIFIIDTLSAINSSTLYHTKYSI